jgi:hypothetical protein
VKETVIIYVFAFIIIIIAIAFYRNESKAMTCALIEAEGSTETAETKLKAEIKAWHRCISRKYEIRQHYRKDMSEYEILNDAEACLNARIDCK